MCRGVEHVHDEAKALLADLMHDLCAALDPEHPESVVVGPVDFGGCDE